MSHGPSQPSNFANIMIQPPFLALRPDDHVTHPECLRLVKQRDVHAMAAVPAAVLVLLSLSWNRDTCYGMCGDSRTAGPEPDGGANHCESEPWFMALQLDVELNWLLLLSSTAKALAHLF